ncbi:survival motor neuron protein-like isoform X2 [Cheilinus undulatus]|uniref:survival motor neuron protein-like isoform X2 n=1 Tax=Cheilinus undulatus TaxID=241271 RepID=UPI001BD4BA62|nr:survival motor neuron protein-like isoform X2 [Cheilinus undulatus]
MTESSESIVLTTPVEQDSKTEAVKDQTAPEKGSEKPLENSQDVVLKECAASEETGGKEKAEQEDGQQDAGTAFPPAAEPTCTETQWAVGAQCKAVWSEDGQVYTATVVSLNGEHCRVRFNGFGNEEDMELSALKSPDAALKIQRQDSQEWRPGSRCRAVYSGDSLVYPAVVVWVKGQRCCVRYDEYNNEEEQDVGSLMSANELHGPNRAASKGGRRTPVSSRRDEKPGERGSERRSAWRDDQHTSTWVKEKFSSQTKAEKEEKKKDGAEKPTNPSFPLFPPFPPPPQLSSGDSLSFVPPPPPPWVFGGKESAGADSVYTMLMMWYLCGFHTGSYLTQQASKTSSKD